jgi:hypothetical protein
VDQDYTFHMRYFLAALLEMRRVLKRDFFSWSYSGKNRAVVEDFCNAYNAGGEL